MESRSKNEEFSWFPMIQEFMWQRERERERDENNDNCGRSSKRRKRFDVDDDQRKLSSVFTPEWREAVTSFAQNIPMDLLIREFNRYYKNVPAHKDCKAVALVERENGTDFDFPDDVIGNILSKIRVTEILASWSISDDWARVCASEQLRSENVKVEKFIVINNSNLDIWAFSLVSKRWLLLNLPCDWEELGMKTLGVKATFDGLFLVARSDFNLFVVNPLKSQLISLPTIILPHNSEDLYSLVVDGTAEMLLDWVTGVFQVYLFGNCEAAGGQSCSVHLAQYSSATNLWTLEQILLHGVPLSSTCFPSPLSSFRRGHTLTCISSNFQSFRYECGRYATVAANLFLNIPRATIDFKNHQGSLPIMLPCRVRNGDSGLILVGRLNENESGKGMFGKLPIVPHSSLGIWKIFGRGQWEMIDTIKAEVIEDMIKSSEGTDFLLVGDGHHTIWFMLRGSDSMVEYNTITKELLMLPGCPGGGYMDTNFHWKAVLAKFLF